MGLNTITKKREIEYEGYSLDKEYIYLTTTCPLCGDTKLEHFVPLDEEITVDEILEEVCFECKEIMGMLDNYEEIIEEME